jgi:hypothetical protein
MYNVKILTDQDYRDALKIASLKSNTTGRSAVSLETLNNKLSRYFIKENEDDCLAIGCFDRDELISWIAIIFVENKSKGRYWAITSLYTTKFTNFFSFNNPEIGLLIKHSFEIAESRKYYQYYYSIAEKVAKVYETQIQKTTYIPIGRYDYLEVERIPPNTQPESPLYWLLIGGTLKPDTMIIKKRVLREKYR